MYAKSPRIAQIPRTHTYRGQSVLQWRAGWFGVLMNFLIIKPLKSEFYFTEQYIILTRTEEGLN